MDVCTITMRITLEPEVINSLEELTGKNISKNGNEIIAEVVEMAESSKKPDSLCWMESNCSEQEQEETS